MNERFFCHEGFPEDIAGITEPADGMRHQVGVLRCFIQHSIHPFQDTGMDISGDITKVCRDLAFYQRAVYRLVFMIHFIDGPDTTGNGNLVTDWRRFDNGSQLLGIRAYRIFYILLEDSIELIVIYNTLTGKTRDQTSGFRPVNMICCDQMPQQDAVIILTDRFETVQCQHSGRQFSRRHFTVGRKRAHCLMIQKTVRVTSGAWGFYKPLFQIQLYQGDALDQIPGNEISDHCPGCGMILPHDKPHFRWISPASGSSHTLQES